MGVTRADASRDTGATTLRAVSAARLNSARLTVPATTDAAHATSYVTCVALPRDDFQRLQDMLDILDDFDIDVA